jgi:hypothetical protein
LPGFVPLDEPWPDAVRYEGVVGGEPIEEEIGMAVNWNRDVDSALVSAQNQSRPLLLDFSAAPA